MKIAIRTIVLAGGLLLTASAFGYFFWYKPKFDSLPKNNSFAFTENDTKAKTALSARIKQKAALAKDYIAGHSFDDEHCFLMDMRIPSGKNRFFVYNLQKDSVELAGLVTHGSGSQAGGDELTFSNTPNSYCTSLGKYKIGKSYYGRFGLAFKLHGLDNSNNKALDRFVVLHGHDCVPNSEVYPISICLSLGCPTVSPQFLSKLETYLDLSAKSVMLWIYY